MEKITQVFNHVKLLLTAVHQRFKIIETTSTKKMRVYNLSEYGIKFIDELVTITRRQLSFESALLRLVTNQNAEDSWNQFPSYL